MENTKTTFRPILFSTPMVQAILEGRKTMTRRTKGLEKTNKNPDGWEFWRFFNGYAKICQKDNVLNEKFIKCPCQVGDVFWVRETFYQTTVPEFKEAYLFKASTDEGWKFKWKPSIFMPKEACRIFLKIKSIRVERLQDISEEDAKKEGIKVIEMDEAYFDYQFNGNNGSFANAKGSFYSLWILINGEKSWSQNPFVWVYEFEQIEKPLDFIV